MFAQPEVRLLINRKDVIVLLVSINGIDLTPHIIAESYDINSYEEYALEWTDANGVSHKHLLREKVKGKFTMKFLYDGGVSYKNFVNLIASNKVENRINIELYVNNLDKTKQINAYITFNPIVERSLTSGKRYKKFNVEVEER